jgi:lipopolysaccharide transport system ATP-binding protein
MSAPAIVFDRVWKRFRKGQRHNSLRDLVPAMLRQVVGGHAVEQLHDQEFWALNDVSFEVKPGEVLGIIGPNGAGKSTTLKLLTKILKPTRGRCEVRGRVGALIELAAGFHPDLTGRENVYLQGAIMGMSRIDITRRFDGIVAFAGVDGFIDTQVKRYSSGMQARLGFAIAAHLEPEVLLIDEVLAVGDYSFRQKCFESLAQFRRGGVPIVFVSHDLQAIASISDHSLLLRPGMEAVVGSTPEILALYRSPASANRHDRATLVSAILRNGHGRPVRDPIRPTSQLTLEGVVAISTTMPRCCVGFEVIRHDGMVMFAASPMFDGTQPMDLSAGSTLDVKIAFSANLLKGLYTVNLHFVDDRRIWDPVALRSVAMFIVQETSRVDGVAELNPLYTLVQHGYPTPTSEPIDRLSSACGSRYRQSDSILRSCGP